MLTRTFSIVLFAITSTIVHAVPYQSRDLTSLAAITGTYNATFIVIPVTLEHALSKTAITGRLPLDSFSTPADPALYPGLTSDQRPLILELGREANAGPPGLSILSFQEAKIEVPGVKRMSSSNTPFLYKRWFAVDNKLDLLGSVIQYGVNTSLRTFIPADSSKAPTYDYTVEGAISGAFTSVPHGKTPQFPLETYTTGAEMPWFSDYPTCAKHTYAFSPPVSPFEFLQGSVTLFPPYAGPKATGPVTFPASAVHVVASFNITLPIACSSFV